MDFSTKQLHFVLFSGFGDLGFGEVWGHRGVVFAVCSL